MKVLLVIDNLGSGGAQNQIVLLANELVTRNIGIDIFTYYPQDFFRDNLNKNIKSFSITKKGKVGLNVIWSLIKLIRKENYTHIVSFLDTPNFYASIAKIIARKEVKLIISYRSQTDISSLPFLSKLIKEKVNIIADYIVFNSFHEKNNWIINYPFLKNKSFTIYNCIDENKFYPPFSYRKKLNKLLVVGSVGPAKNGLIIIEAMQILKVQENLNFSLSWFGEIYKHLSARKIYYDKMLKLINYYNLVDYWKWEIPSKNILKVYHEYDALILASKVEGLPNVVCEAMASGLPTIVSDKLDHAYLVDDGITGYLFDPDNAHSLSDVIISFYDLSSLEYCKMQEKSYLKSIDLFNKNSFIDKYLQLMHIV